MLVVRAKVTTSARFVECAQPRVLFARVLNWLMIPPLPVIMILLRIRAILNLKVDHLLFPQVPNSRFVTWDSRRAAIWIHPCLPNQFHEVPLTIESVSVCRC